MATYSVRHLHGGQTFERPHVFENSRKQDRTWLHPSTSNVRRFHESLPDYNETALHDLPSLAQDLGIGHVFVKDESNRFGLPAFKILGASWAVHQSICLQIGLVPEETSFGKLHDVLKSQSSAIHLVTCTVGNWGRAMARTARYLGIPARIYVPAFTSNYTKRLINDEGAELEAIGDSYDECLAATQKAAAASGSLLVVDVSWDGYQDVPLWAVEGYGTMLQEADQQVAAATNGKRPSLVVTGVGGGQWARAVVTHYKAKAPDTTIIGVEPDTAAGFKESLHSGDNTIVESANSIMAGLNNGHTDDNAWPFLRDGVDVAVAVTDRESHESVEYLQHHEVNAGPCGGATLAGLRKLFKELPLKDPKEATVVLFSTEGNREYQVPD